MENYAILMLSLWHFPHSFSQLEIQEITFFVHIFCAWQNNVRACHCESGLIFCFKHSLTFEILPKFQSWVKIWKLSCSRVKNGKCWWKSCHLIWQLSTTPVSHSLSPLEFYRRQNFRRCQVLLPLFHPSVHSQNIQLFWI